ncbi:MAG: hypothetical protein HYY95_10000 [Candidatus Rokubacteria bacterium]|nr:hypothetical protein [Candidatus Rokubacteria bacterium]MBI3105887.1 hypothetical protein [Candidatus Rokubacteria bacterium]
MARYICIVSRDHPLLAGYLMVALAPDASPPGEMEVVLDRRREPGAPDSVARSTGLERRNRQEVEATLRTQPYVCLPEPPQRSLARERVLVVAREPEAERLREVVRWPLMLALAVLGVAIVALGAVALGPPREVADPSRAITPAPMPEAAPAPADPPLTAALPEAAPADPSAPAAASGGETRVSPAPAPGSRVPSVPGPSLPGRLATAAPGASAGPVLEGPVDRGPVFPGLPSVELASRREGQGASRSIVYTARVRDADGQPVEAASVSLLTVLSDGTRREVPLSPVSEPGAYRGRDPAGDGSTGDLRVRVAVHGRRFEVPIFR